MKTNLKPEERLIVAADFPADDSGISGACEKVLELAEQLKGLGVYIKLNSILRAAGYSLIQELHQQGLKIFADLKLIDIPNTLKNDAGFLKEVEPELVTVMACAGVEAMMALQNNLSAKTKVLAVTVLTSLNEEQCQTVFTCSTKAGVLRFARMAQLAGLSNLILSPKEVAVILQNHELALVLNTPGIRPAWSVVKGDDQKRVLTPAEAIKNGADRLVIGRPIIQAAENNKGLPQNPRQAVERTLEEIKEALK